MFRDLVCSGWAALSMIILLGTDPSSASGEAAQGNGIETTAGSLPDGVVDRVWEWTWFGSGAEQFNVEHPEQYSLQFFADGSLALQADCNRGRGEYAVDSDGQITLSRLSTTMMLCDEPSRADQFLQSLEQVRLFFEMDGDFFLEAPIGSGTLRFRQADDGE